MTDNISNGNGRDWERNKLLVLHEIKQNRVELKEFEKEFVKSRSEDREEFLRFRLEDRKEKEAIKGEIRALKVKASTWGGIAGFVFALIVNIALVVYQVNHSNDNKPAEEPSSVLQEYER